jgi:hypothetical protein
VTDNPTGNEDREGNEPRPPAGFHKLLNQHGYGFHYAVLREAHRLFQQQLSRWVFVTSEFPVSVRGTDTRIDFVLEHADHSRCYIIAECKRANPAMANWCFARAPYTRQGHSSEGIYVDHLSWSETGEMKVVEVANLQHTSEVYHLALEAKTGDPGDPAGKGRGEIDGAATQVLRGVNGLIETWARAKVGANEHKFLIPVVFTTANLWACDAALAAADLATGNLQPEQVGLLPMPWAAYQFPASESLKHEKGRRPQLHGHLPDILHHEYVRTVQFVTPAAIGPFLTYMSNILE